MKLEEEKKRQEESVPDFNTQAKGAFVPVGIFSKFFLKQFIFFRPLILNISVKEKKMFF